MKIKLVLVILAVAIFVGCAKNQPTKIDRTSPCACYDIILKAS